MNLKQRITGAIVLVALAVIFVPWLLQENKQPDIKMSVIPARPDAPQVNNTINIAPVTLEPSTTQKTSQAAWTLQLATFSSESNANNLVKRLQAKAYTAYSVKLNTNNKILYKVYVGPELDKARLTQEAKTIQTSMGVKGTIMPYTAVPGQEG